MADIFDYLSWRGDIPFSIMGVNDVDALIFSVLSYVFFDGVVPETPGDWVSLRKARDALVALPEYLTRGRVEEDLKLLDAAADTWRYGSVRIGYYQNFFEAEEETQFAAVTFLTDDGSAFLAFRGTDNTIIGWKEDFNMTFRKSVPAQRLAAQYTRRFAEASAVPLRLGGHSKGGNLAVYAAAKSEMHIQNRIIEVFNHDGPGFTQEMMSHEGYLRIVPKVRTLIPKSSVFGMLLEHAEPYTVIESTQKGLLQHDPYSWVVLGKEFIYLEQLGEDSRFLDKTIRLWLEGLDNGERSEFFDAVFDLLLLENASQVKDILRPQNIKTLFKTLQMDEEKRKMIGSVLTELLEAAKSTYNEMGQQS